MSGHTPGPWKVTRDYSIVTDSSPPILLVTTRSANFAANAKLIAAAPDLLAALQSCADQIAIFAATGRRVPIDAPCLDAALAAISKATGVSHA